MNFNPTIERPLPSNGSGLTHRTSASVGVVAPTVDNGKWTRNISPVIGDQSARRQSPPLLTFTVSPMIWGVGISSPTTRRVERSIVIICMSECRSRRFPYEWTYLQLSHSDVFMSWGSSWHVRRVCMQFHLRVQSPLFTLTIRVPLKEGVVVFRKDLYIMRPHSNLDLIPNW